VREDRARANERHKECIRLREEEGLTYAEIAARLRTSKSYAAAMYIIATRKRDKDKPA
jgi:DNA-directed RNA polymerase specialized sigma24 family protein